MNTPQLIRDGLQKVGMMYLNAAKKYPPENNLSHEDVYGQPTMKTGVMRTRDGGYVPVSMMTSFKTVKQAIWFWATRPADYFRTNTTMFNWDIATTANTVNITNTVPYAKYLHSNKQQSVFARKVGWKSVYTILMENKSFADAIMTLEMRKLGAP